MGNHFLARVYCARHAPPEPRQILPCVFRAIYSVDRGLLLLHGRVGNSHWRLRRHQSDRHGSHFPRRGHVHSRPAHVRHRGTTGFGRHGRVFVHRQQHLRRARGLATTVAAVLGRERALCRRQGRFALCVHSHPRTNACVRDQRNHGVWLEDDQGTRIQYVCALCYLSHPAAAARVQRAGLRRTVWRAAASTVYRRSSSEALATPATAVTAATTAVTFTTPISPHWAQPHHSSHTIHVAVKFQPYSSRRRDVKVPVFILHKPVKTQADQRNSPYSN